MGIPYQNRVLVISLALAGGGILACVLAAADAFLPQRSTIAVLVSIPLFGSLAFFTLFAFAWTCELLRPARVPSRSKSDSSQAKRDMPRRQRAARIWPSWMSDSRSQKLPRHCGL